MRIRTTLFAVTLTTAALLGSAGTAAADGADGATGPGSGPGSDVSDGSRMGGLPDGPERQGVLGADSSVGRGVSDTSPVAFVGRLMGM